MKTLHKIIVALLMLILPLQGASAAFAPVLNGQHGSAGAAMPCHEHPAQHGTGNAVSGTSSVQHAPVSDMPRDSDAANHQCCHQIFACAPACMPAPSAHKFGDVSGLVLPLATLFIPDSPDRPPRG